MAKAQSNDKQTFRGTVQELAGTMALNGQVLNLQDVQFLTRIGNGSFAKKVGTAPGTGTRGGKRATIWEITPSAKLAFDAHEASAEEKGKAKQAQTKQAAPQAVDPAVLTKAVQEAVQNALGQSAAAPAPRRKRRTKAEIEADKAASAKAA